MFSRHREPSASGSLTSLRSRFKSSMSSSAKIRSSEGCWTCRLRRKKCDEARPVCEGCASLEITCHYSDAKPDWMDGGERQKEMADHLKKLVKIQANNRRERKYLQSLDVDGQGQGQQHHHHHGHHGQDDSDGEHIPPVPALSADGGSSKETNSTSPSTVHDTPGDTSSPAFQLDAVKSSIHEIAPAPAPASASAPAPSPPNPDWSAAASNSHPSPAAPDVNPTTPFPDDSNLGFIMIYLDYVFPFLFPFYKPALLEGGRGWLLNVLNHNKALYHTALSLSSHFFGVVLNGAQVEHTPCRIRSVASLQHQLDLALRELRADMAAIDEAGDVQRRLTQSCRVLESIVQLLVFDVTLASNDHWQMHLDAATVVFQQILLRPDDWDPTMHQMAIPLLQGVHFPPGSHKPWSSDQAALRFFTASLLYFDIISATSLERPPRLQGYHHHLLSPRREEAACLEVEPRLRLEEYFGCQSWVLRLIGEIAALDAWKKENRRAGSLSVTHLVSRAACLELALREGIACIENQCPQLMGTSSTNDVSCRAAQCFTTGDVVLPPPHPTHVDTTRLPPDPLTLYQSEQTRDTVEASRVHTKIWAHAALAYLSTVVSGWQPSCPETAGSVRETIALLDSLHSPVCLRTVVWPFCVIGCLATPLQEHMFREMVGRMGALEVFGSIRAALGVMENVWARREAMDETWDLAACFKIMGHPVLLT